MKKQSPRQYRSHCREFKIKAVARIENGENISALSRGLKIRRNMLNRWRDTFRQFCEGGFRGRGRPATQDGEPASRIAEPDPAAERIAQLEQKIGQRTILISF